MKGPLGPSVSIIKSRVEVLHCHHTKRAPVRLFFLFSGSAVLYLRAGGESIVSVRLRVPKRERSCDRWKVWHRTLAERNS